MFQRLPGSAVDAVGKLSSAGTAPPLLKEESYQFGAIVVLELQPITTTEVTATKVARKRRRNSRSFIGEIEKRLGQS